MSLVFHSVLPVTITESGTTGSLDIDLTGLIAGDFVFGCFCELSDSGTGLVTWPSALDDSFAAANIANFGGYGWGHTFYAVYNGTDTSYTLSFVDGGFYAEICLACVACAYRGNVDPATLPLSSPTSGGEESFRYPGGSFTSSFTLTPPNIDDLLITAQVLPTDNTPGTVTSPYTLRASSVGTAFSQDVHERTVGDPHYRGIGLTGSLSPQAQIADLTSVTAAETPTWTNSLGSGWTTSLDAFGHDTGVPLEGVGMAHWLMTHGATGLYVWKRL